ncbi:uncharacterized protein LOC123306700 [Coccinella septempunctata]|uniref:uncharacterized protein LOC123306700 n=1 Tax=Coccinella septempunctata TaxID=41139 RepID=UPI001D08924A|nr:uncharacterized protein LOC123306700 [Coccinella septempunctata]
MKCFKTGSKTYKELSEAEQKQCADFLIAKNPYCALSKIKKGRRALPVSTSTEADPDWLHPLLDNIEKSTFLSGLRIEVEKFDLRDCCKTTYSTLIEADIPNILKTCHSGCENWKTYRKYRLTGSRCYSIFTYSKLDWPNKSLNHFNPKGFTNKFVQHGVIHEREARECYKSKLGYCVVETGFLICNRYPWLGFSPDGVIFEEGKPFRLLEIKCPFVGRTKSAAEFFGECDYLELAASGLKLKQNHSYYAQVQLGMALLNLRSCDLVLYSSFSKTFLKVVVPFDEVFAKTSIEKISFNYFTHMIHVICENKRLS